MDMTYPPPGPDATCDAAQHVVDAALHIVRQRLARRCFGKANRLADVRRMLTLRLSQQPARCMAVVWTTSRHVIVADTILFRGTLSHCSCPLRELAMEALRHYASGAIIAINKIDCACEPTPADLQQLRSIRDTLAIIDVHLLDFLIVAGGHFYSALDHGKL